MFDDEYVIFSNEGEDTFIDGPFDTMEAAKEHITFLEEECFPLDTTMPKPIYEIYKISKVD